MIGLASAWGFGVPVTVLTVDALNSRPDFLRDSYQNFAVFPFVLLGTVMVLVWVAGRVSWGRIVSVVVGAAVLGPGPGLGRHRVPGLRAVDALPGGPHDGRRASAPPWPASRRAPRPSSA